MGVDRQSHAPGPLYPWKQTGWVGLRAAEDTRGESRRSRNSIPGQSTPQRAAIQTDRSRQNLLRKKRIKTYTRTGKILHKITASLLLEIPWHILSLMPVSGTDTHTRIFIFIFLLVFIHIHRGTAGYVVCFRKDNSPCHATPCRAVLTCITLSTNYSSRRHPSRIKTHFQFDSNHINFQPMQRSVEMKLCVFYFIISWLQQDAVSTPFIIPFS
jgi:hypothetical protein